MLIKHQIMVADLQRKCKQTPDAWRDILHNQIVHRKIVGTHVGVLDSPSHPRMMLLQSLYSWASGLAEDVILEVKLGGWRGKTIKGRATDKSVSQPVGQK